MGIIFFCVGANNIVLQAFNYMPMIFKYKQRHDLFILIYEKCCTFIYYVFCNNSSINSSKYVINIKVIIDHNFNLSKFIL